MKKNKTVKVKVNFMLNGKPISCEVNPSLLLIDLLRDQLELMGTKPGCLEGECGACSVLIDGAAVNSCMFLAINAEGKKITTIEGLENSKGLDEVQQAMIDSGAVQCGFCSSGMVISIKSMQEHYKKQKKKKPSREEIQKGLEGNLCRCTGYVKIIEAAEKVLKA